ncbi:hypothetical protein [Mycoplasma capricolum]|uniref:Uncharacterized protein n=1 Tax=Mycoplasma capricolum subsp. capricolum 14232 TaxID=1188238 RepID=A0A084EJ57_MYCCA|nr:hypothetical protein [Mycoplasma capricolum]KEZ17999.1 Hypothetical protein, predicted transmembrane protein [Mycoplasma capricolum subsp. capricolum 14232]
MDLLNNINLMAGFDSFKLIESLSNETNQILKICWLAGLVIAGSMFCYNGFLCWKSDQEKRKDKLKNMFWCLVSGSIVGLAPFIINAFIQAGKGTDFKINLTTIYLLPYSILNLN